MDKDDPNAGLFGYDETEPSDEEKVYQQMYDKNPKRVDALGSLTYEEITAIIDSQEGIDDEAKRQMLFKMTASTILDLVMDATDIDTGMDISYSVDMYIGVALANQKYHVDLFKEHEKALTDVQPSKFPTEDDYKRALEEFEGAWWDVPQPKLEKRTPNDAIREALDEYGLTD